MFTVTTKRLSSTLSVLPPTQASWFSVSEDTSVLPAYNTTSAGNVSSTPSPPFPFFFLLVSPFLARLVAILFRARPTGSFLARKKRHSLPRRFKRRLRVSFPSSERTKTKYSFSHITIRFRVSCDLNFEPQYQTTPSSIAVCGLRASARDRANMSSSTPPLGVRPSPSSDSRRKRLSRSAQRRKDRFQTRRTRGGTAAHSDKVTTEGGSRSAARHELGSRDADEDVEEGTPRRCWPFFRVFVEKKYMRQFFRYGWGPAGTTVCDFLCFSQCLCICEPSVSYILCSVRDLFRGRGEGQREMSEEVRLVCGDHLRRFPH